MPWATSKNTTTEQPTQLCISAERKHTEAWALAADAALELAWVPFFGVAGRWASGEEEWCQKEYRRTNVNKRNTK